MILKVDPRPSRGDSGQATCSFVHTRFLASHSFVFPPDLFDCVQRTNIFISMLNVPEENVETVPVVARVYILTPHLGGGGSLSEQVL